VSWADVKAQEAYEKRELQEFHNDLRRIATSSRSEVMESISQFANDANPFPKLIAERAQWLINGDYGFGAFIFARDVMRNKTVEAAVRDLLAATAALEWGVPTGRLEEALRYVDPSPKAKIRRLIGLQVGRAKFENRAEVQRIRKMEQKAEDAIKSYTTSAHAAALRQRGAAGGMAFTEENLRRAGNLWVTISDAWLEAGYPREARRAAVRANRHYNIVPEPKRIGVFSRDAVKKRRRRR